MASLFRNFLLADRIMRAASCTPASYPRLPSTHQHPMWQVRIKGVSLPADPRSVCVAGTTVSQTPLRSICYALLPQAQYTSKDSG